MKIHKLILPVILLFLSTPLMFGQSGETPNFNSIRSFGVLQGNSADLNKANLLKAIDWASRSGAVLFMEPSEGPCVIGSGIILKKNVR